MQITNGVRSIMPSLFKNNFIKYMHASMSLSILIYVSDLRSLLSKVHYPSQPSSMQQYMQYNNMAMGTAGMDEY